ncbi:zinc-binding dehydrogenase [Streptomyces sp. NPDC007983]|uniref:zinc-binding dehydrogenase n=1 Tax=Streptomyces sp. NPDC007983 TaxID=3364800 RepID=UPI0036E194EF
MIATTSNEKKAARLLELGASNVINYVSTPDWGNEVRKLTAGQGTDVIVEVGGAGTRAQSIAAIAYAGVISLVGHLAHDTTGMNLLDFTYSGATLRAIGGGSRSDLEDMIRVIAAYKLRPVIDRVFPFEEAPVAASSMERGGRFGKVVIQHH